MSKAHRIHDRKNHAAPRHHGRARPAKHGIARTAAPQAGRDVVCGRGEKFKQFNVHYRKLIARFAPAYHVCVTNETKRALANEVYRIIQSRQGRFFREDFEEMSKKDSVYKIMRALKDYPRRGSGGATAFALSEASALPETATFSEASAIFEASAATGPQSQEIESPSFHHIATDSSPTNTATPQSTSEGEGSFRDSSSLAEDDDCLSLEDVTAFLNIDTIWSGVPLEDLMDLEGVMERLDDGRTDFEFPDILK